MTKPELGTKRLCLSCKRKFYDLNKTPIVCPKCAAAFVMPNPAPVRLRRVLERQPAPAELVTMPTEMPAEFVSLIEANADTEDKNSAADADDANGGFLVLDEHDEDIDPADIIPIDKEVT